MALEVPAALADLVALEGWADPEALATLVGLVAGSQEWPSGLHSSRVHAVAAGLPG